MISFKELESLGEVRGKENFDLLKLDIDDAKLTFCTDTRDYKEELVFIGIEGARFRPLSFAHKIQSPIIICERNEYNLDVINSSESLKEKVFVLVDSVLEVLTKLASRISYKFKQNAGRLIAISGSNGKTTTKEMLFHILSNCDHRTVCTQKNNNNHIGVPLTLFQISWDTKNCIVELGSNHPGEIKHLVDMIEPNIGLCTNVGETHLEFFENLESVFEEEGYLIKYLLDQKESVSFVNNEDAFLRKYGTRSNALKIGTSDECDYQYGLEGNIIRLKYPAKDQADSEVLELVNNNITGTHNFINLLSSASICLELGEEPEQVKSFAQRFLPSRNRSQWIKVEECEVFLDAYNANPSSMKSSILGFLNKSLEKGLKIEELGLILGDMNELGKHSEAFHKEIGLFCKELGFRNIYFVGKFRSSYNYHFKDAKTFENTLELKEQMGDKVFKHKGLFIKGSRSLQLETMLDISLC